MRDPKSMKYLTDLGLPNVNWYPDALFTWRTRYAPLLDSGLSPHTPELLETWPDSNRIFRKQDNWPSEYICLSAAAPEAPAHATRHTLAKPGSFYEKLITGLMEQTGLKVVVADPCGDEFLKPLCDRLDLPYVPSTANLFAGTGLLAGARAFVGGRYHPAVMASLGGTPCTFLQGHEHEADRLLHVLEYDTSAVFPVDESEENIQAIIDDIASKIAAGDDLRNHLVSKVYTMAYKSQYGIRTLFHDVATSQKRSKTSNTTAIT